jgi:hypothetical protein
MTDTSRPSNRCLAIDIANINHLFNHGEQILCEHRQANPDLYRLLEERRAINEVIASSEKETPVPIPQLVITNESMQEVVPEPLYFKRLAQKVLKEKIAASHKILHAHHLATGSVIVPRTSARNIKTPYSSVEGERADRSEKVSAQIQSWRTFLPTLISRFAEIRDPRRAKSVKHKLVVLMLYGLFAFIFRLKSRREMNRELTGPMIFENLQKLFPELESIPHADTIARLLERININDIEKAHIAVINKLIRNKKFKQLLISGCLPIAIDGTQKLYRDGELQDLNWLDRKVGSKESPSNQQYIYLLEANIVFQNGLTIPLLSEYLKTDWSVLTNPEGKQECELVAFERLSARLKRYFPRLKIMVIADALFATQSVLGKLHDYKWEYVIQFSKNKLINFAKLLNAKKVEQQSIQGRSYYRERHQAFCWYNDVTWGHEWQLNIHLVSCLENWKEVDKNTGEIITKHSQNQWISSIKISINNVHELCNLGARKIWLMEDSINTEKHRGYHYEHTYSYDWQGMQGFHLLMRMAHAINAISEFTKKLKKWIKAHGCDATLKLIKETLFNPWLSIEWYEAQNTKPIRLQLQLE